MKNIFATGAARRRLCLNAVAALCLLAPAPAAALQNGLARTPPMGWNSYNKFGGNVTEAQVKAIVDAFVSDGLKDAGFEYIVVDYCWMQGRDSSGQMVPVPSKFPSGMKALSDYVHSKGLKFGMYQSPTKVTCCGEPGSYQHEASDAKQFAGWGVDYVKYDWCGVQSKENGTVTTDQVIARYTAMRDAIQASGRPMVYAMCEKGQGAKVQPATWSEPVGNMWRTGNDIAATWARVLTSFDVVRTLGQYAKPGGWNDPDMLEVGNGSLTEAENRAHLSLWAIVAAPLMMGNDPSKMTASVKSILTNAEVIAVDQDPLGDPGERISTSGQTEVWSKLMADGSVAVVLFNRGTAPATISVKWSDLKISGTAKIRDLWQHADKDSSASGYSASVASHDVAMVRVYPPGVEPGMGGAGGGGTGGGSAGTSSSGSGGSAPTAGAAPSAGSDAGGALNVSGASSVAGGSSASGSASISGAPATVAGASSSLAGAVSGGAANSGSSEPDSGCSCSVLGARSSSGALSALAGLALFASCLSRRARRKR